MKVERFHIATVDDRLDILEAAFHPIYGNSSPSGIERRLVHMLYIILRDIGEGYVAMTRHALILVPLLLSVVAILFTI